ncbi:MAG TPA: hypothetical protein VK956_20075 [Verrucomicrobium sp.]|nr:hypothetical protein [Verrucomicrobium sp.]
MPLDLKNLLWQNLTTAYELPCDDVISWLGEAYSVGLTSELLGDIINEVQHQGDTSDAMYAVAPHLILLASRTDEELARQSVIHAGLIHASSQSPSAIPCPPELLADFRESAAIGTQRVLSLLPHASEFEDFKYLVAALAGFMQHGRFGNLVEGFEFLDGQFHHPNLSDPFPE